MKKLTLFLTAITLTFSMPAYAEAVEAKTEMEQATQSGDVHLSINGLVCDFCARALEKVFGKQDEVSTIDVNLDTKIITVNFHEGQTLSDEKLTELITEAGYNVEDIHRAK